MILNNFDRFRIEADSSVFMDVEKIGHHSEEGFMVTAYEMKGNKPWIEHKVEVRKKNNQIALITYQYSDSKIPDYWKDSEVIYSWIQGDESK